jgi:hypothetical protein
MSWRVLLFVVVGAAGCGALEPPSTTSSVAARQQDGGTCHPMLNGTGQPGDRCTKSSDCREVCCACQSGSKGFNAAACVDQVCADAVETCEKGEENTPSVCAL